MKTFTVAEFQAALLAQGVSAREHFAMVCPRCKTVQSIASFGLTGQFETPEQAEPYFGFSCVGRFVNAPAARAEPDGKPCNWMVRGFLQLHECEVIDSEGVPQAIFAPATPEQAQEHERKVIEELRNVRP